MANLASIRFGGYSPARPVLSRTANQRPEYTLLCPKCARQLEFGEEGFQCGVDGPIAAARVVFRPSD